MTISLVRLLAVLAAAAVALLVPALVELPWGPVVLMVVLIGILFGASIWYRAEKQLPFLCDPVVLVCAFQAQFFLVGPLGLPYVGSHFLFRVPVDLVVFTLGMFLLMQGAFIVGYQMRVGAVLSDLLPDFSGGHLKLPGRWIETLIILGSLLGCAGFVWDLGGLDYIVSLAYGRGRRSSAFFLLAFHAIILGTMLMAWRLITSRPRKKVDFVLFVLLLLTEVVFFGPVLGARKRLFFLFFGLFGVWLLRHGTARLPRRVATVMMVLLLVFFSFWGTVRSRPLREIVERRSAPANVAQGGPIYLGYLASVAEPLAVACMVMELFPDTEPYRYGRTLLVTLLGFIPRSAWPDKPVGIGKELTRYTDGIYYEPNYGHSVATTLLGDYYINMGLPGVLIGGLCFGILCRTMAAYASKGMRNGSQKNPARVLVTAVFLASLVEIRGDTAGILAFYGMTYPYLIVALMFFRLDYERSTTPETG